MREHADTGLVHELDANPAIEWPEQRALRGAAVGSVAIALPDDVVANAPIAERLGVDERWIVERTGVRQRRIAPPEMSVSDLAAQAGAAALERSGLEPDEVDLLLMATTTHDHVTPNAAPLVAAKIGATHAGAVDVGAACTAFVSAIALAGAQIEAGRAERVLVIGADLLSRVTDRDDRRTAALFGDGAGAVVMSATDGARLGPAIMGADGERADLIRAPFERPLISMNGHDTFVQATLRLSEVTAQAVAAAGLDLADVDLFVYHQANSRIIRAVGERLELPAERVIDCVPSYGNTSAASIPIALAEAERDGRLSEGMTVLIAAFGAGLTWGGAVLEWGGDRV
jgi:3-oxoacyl-[acyl-carrier-protein] synthase III